MVQTYEAINGFEKLVKDHHLEGGKETKTILEAIEKIRTAVPAVYHPKHVEAFLTQRANALDALVSDYLVAKFAPKYPQLSTDIWRLKRFIQVKSNGDGKLKIVKDERESPPVATETGIISMALLAYCQVNSSHVCELAKGKTKVGHNDYNYTLTAKMPGELGSNLRKSYRTALSESMKAIHELLDKNGIGECLTEKFDNVYPEFGVTWIPQAEDLTLKSEVVIPPAPKPDPAMVMGFRDRKLWFVVDMWSVDDEEPLEHFLREYTVGSTKLEK